MGFLKEYRVIGISIGFIVAIAASNFVQSLVNDIILPLLRPLVSRGTTQWEDMIFSVGSINFRIGSFLSSFLQVFYVPLFVFS